MTGTQGSTMQFKDAGDYVQVDLPGLSTDGKASFTGDSVYIKNANGSGKPLFMVAQLYSTIDAEHSRMELLPKGVRLHLKKLTPGEAWPQLTAAANAAPEPEMGPANALQERQAVEALLKAAQQGDVEAFKTSASHFGDSNLSSVKDGNERTALHFAAASEQPEMCRYLLTEAGFNNGVQDSAGETALGFAAGTGNLACVKTLLELGADAAHPNSKGGPQAVHRAAASGNIPAVELLLEHGADINAASSAGPPLMWALGEQQEEMAKYLLSHSADVNAVDERNVSACLIAAATGAQQVLDELISKGANVNVAAAGGVTALHIAAESGDVGIVQSLLKAGSDPNTKEPAGNRAIDVAASAQKRDIVELLLPRTSPSKEGEWTVDAVMERGAAADAEQQKHHHHHHGHDHGDCCGCGHEHEHAEEQIDIPEAPEPDQARAAKMKRQGDEAFVKSDFSSAAKAYTQALRHTTSDHTIWANRSAAFLRTGAAEDALQDARRARTIKPDYAKAYYREGSALQALDSWEGAAQAYFMGYRMDPQNAAMAQAFQHAIKKAQEAHKAAHKHG